ncbi:STAS domain-containing protein [Streptomyces sp. TRM43335]|uniref:STAS domain-containing protein n=1 Tax=Streptomyces taklimakanensis TaxID=2569853 RepID=A0A6G2B6K6_9ACTN|nr:STAS domain-containing protein [Streptomyces taklimakanensis]MTE17891.1 STAS domain-containing protein [Streptomyces taklimakanensis]
MTPAQRPSFSLTVETAPRAVRLLVAGDLDYDTSEALVEAARRYLAPGAGAEAPDDLHLDLAGARSCDSTGLSALLRVHRLAGDHGARFHLDRRPPFLERLLDITGTLTHLTSPVEGDGGAEDRSGDG